MSRSVHQTLQQVFYRKSKREVIEMCDPDNPDVDVIEIWKKAGIKNKVMEQRKTEKTEQNIIKQHEIKYNS